MYLNVFKRQILITYVCAPRSKVPEELEDPKNSDACVIPLRLERSRSFLIGIANGHWELTMT